MAEIGREHRRQPGAVVVGGERQRPHRVVGLAAEEALTGERVADVGGGAGTAQRELVEGCWVFIGLAEHVQRVAELVGAIANFVDAVAREERLELGPVGPGRVVAMDYVTVTFVEVADEIGAQ